ncbi:MAG: hypothetical protein M3177_02945 [Pseudomonadota bacterium]|nr:hypothetical protein [Pseudomonadota bacterium]
MRSLIDRRAALHREDRGLRLLPYLRITWFVIKSVLWTFACIAINLIGFLATQMLGNSVLFLDMTGTAFASLTRGIGYGVVVALASNFLGQFLPVEWMPGTYDPEAYKWFAIANAAGAVSWAILPRLRVIGPKLFGWLPKRDIFSSETEFGYRELLIYVSLVGTITGLVVAITGWIVQELILGCGRAPEICANASITASTSLTLTQALNQWVGNDSLSRLATLLAVNVLDKILATAAAIALALSWSHLPNHLQQAQHLADALPRYEASPIRKTATVLYCMFWTFFLVAYIKSPPLYSEADVAVLTASLLFIILLFPLWSIQKVPLYHVFYREGSEDENLFHDQKALRGQSFQRDVLEDVFKIATVLFALVEVLLSEASPGTRLVQLARTVIFLQLLRYFIVFLMRLSGRFDQASTSGTAGTSATPAKSVQAQPNSDR